MNYYKLDDYPPRYMKYNNQFAEFFPDEYENRPEADNLVIDEKLITQWKQKQKNLK
jgi:hypothetical protein